MFAGGGIWVPEFWDQLWLAWEVGGTHRLQDQLTTSNVSVAYYNPAKCFPRL